MWATKTKTALFHLAVSWWMIGHPPAAIGQEYFSFELQREHLTSTSDRIAYADFDLIETAPSNGSSYLPSLAPLDLNDPIQMRFRHLVANANTSGLSGVLYDNRDRGHSRLAETKFRGLTFLTYSSALKDRGLDYSLARVIYPRFTTIGNSSTAYRDGPFGRSLPRAAMTGHDPLQHAVFPFYNNALYVYPEHKDHDKVDLFPANWPYTVVSQGSSGSDQAFVEALLYTLAAFREDTRRRLEEEKLIAPTLQMIMRYSMADVLDPTFYRSGIAHPSVFSAKNLNTVNMMLMANEMRPEAIPPMPRIEVVEESFSERAGLLGRNEKLFDTPASVARVWRNLKGRNRIVLSAADTQDPNGRDLTFDWMLLRGNPRSVDIVKLNEDGSDVEITIDWHDPKWTRSKKGKPSSRIDIGLFVNNGEYDSAPAFFSVMLPQFQNRKYDWTRFDDPVLLEIDYANPRASSGYDPILNWWAPWRDIFEYDDTGQVTKTNRLSVKPRVIAFDQVCCAQVKLPALTGEEQD